jgi:superfamily II DNA or RNA helicase
MQNWYVPPKKYINFYTYDKVTRTYRLPPSCWVGHKKWTDINTPGELSLFGYQQEVVQYCVDLYNTNKKSCMIISWTATGKSHMVMGIIYAIHHKTVIVVPNTLIGKWLQDKLGWLLDARFLIASQVRKLTTQPDVLIVTGASFNNLFSWINDNYDTIICDEWHHLSTNRKDQLNMWKGDFICMLTATPERKEYGLEGFEMYLWNIHDTERQALPVKVYTYEYDYDYTIDEVIKAQSGLSPESPELYRRLYCYNPHRIGHLEQIILYLKTQWFRKIIVFTDRTAHIDLIQNIIPDTIRLTGSEDKTKFLADIADKEDYTIIAMSQCAGEWFDLPALECWILFMSTSWNNTIDQTAGRIRRFSWDKQVAYYIDFIDILRIMWWKKKKLWRYERSRIYKNKGRDVVPFENLLSF